MSENFLKIKKKYMAVAIAASCILGACLGVAVTCALAVIFRTCGVNVHWAVYIPVATVLAAGVGWLFFLILRPDDKRIAKKLDRDFALNQKVQTMVEFAGAEGEIHSLQREQTDEALGEVAKKRVDLKWLLKFAFVPVIALAMLFAGIFVPAKKSGYVDPPYNLTPAHETSLKSLIEDVEGSSLEEGLRVCTVAELNILLGMLQDAAEQSAMREAVTKAVYHIDGLIADTDSYLKIARVLGDNETLESFSTAVINAVVDYKTGSRLTSMRMVKEREKDADERITSVLERWKNSYLAEYAPKAEGEQEGTPLPAAEAAEKLLPFAEALTAGLADESLVNAFGPSGVENRIALFAAESGDALYGCFTALADNLSAHAENISGNDTMYYNNTDGYFTRFISDGTAPLATQSYNCMMDDYIRNALSRIFGISFGSNADVAPSPIKTESGGDDENKGNSGGYGDGVHKYGSDDEILDRYDNESKKYSDTDPRNSKGGTYYHTYFERAMEYVNNEEKPLPDDVANYIRQYFAYLSNGLEEN